MEELLRDGLLSLAIQVYEIGYLLLDRELIVRSGNQQISRWLDRPLDFCIGQDVTLAFPELIGSEQSLKRLREGDPPFRLDTIYRAATADKGAYFDLQAMRLGGDSNALLLITVDSTQQAQQQQLLQQQRNEVQLLSAELTLANERLSYLLNRLVPPSVAELMLNSPILPQPGSGIIREATILFADMRDFTVYAEAYHPRDTLEFLNTYLGVVSEAILRHDGSLIQMVGDMVMGAFNVPGEQPDHTARAVRAAVDIQRSIRAFNERADSRFPAVSFGVGISRGNVIAGYLGAQQRFRYAIVGDATNVAFHLSSLAAPGRILLCEATMSNMGDGFAISEKGNIQLKRRRRPVKVYEMSASNLDA